MSLFPSLFLIMALIRAHPHTNTHARAPFLRYDLVPPQSFFRYDLVLSIDNDVDFFEVGRRSPQGVDAYMMAAARAWAVEVTRLFASHF
ncbi:hypothetical protein T492DRAFT_276292 [Pavlovales sp. CCMP2436]|nr:hypothetical protein T492DRAFT_276292 [Pavlovales sp. CCMP2436]